MSPEGIDPQERVYGDHYKPRRAKPPKAPTISDSEAEELTRLLGHLTDDAHPDYVKAVVSDLQARIAQAEIKGAIAENQAISNTLTRDRNLGIPIKVHKVLNMLNDRLEALIAQLKATEGEKQ